MQTTFQLTIVDSWLHDMSAKRRMLLKYSAGEDSIS